MKNDDCLTCLKDRKAKQKAPRRIVSLPVEITNNKDFRKKNVPVRLCEYCDGDALPTAVLTHEKP